MEIYNSYKQTLQTKLTNIFTSREQHQLIKRHSNQCCMLLFGLTGAGKSSIINHLFDIRMKEKELAKTSNSTSSTRVTSEYKLVIENRSYCVNIVDTPGYGDTNGFQQDMRNMYTIKKFFQQREFNNILPNIILIVISSTDNRYEGEESKFVKCLKHLNELNIVDKDCPNVVTVMTHCCSMSPNYLTNYPKWCENIETMKQRIQKLVRINLEIDTEIVLLENHYEDEKLNQPQLETGELTDFTELPNKQLQPFNLYETILNVFQSIGDKTGAEHFNNCFLKDDDESGLNKEVIKGVTIECTEDVLSISPNETNNEYQLKCNKFIKYNKSLINKVESIDEILEIVSLLSNKETTLATVGYVEFLLNRGLSDIGKKFVMEELKFPEMVVDVKLIDYLQCGYDLFKNKFLSESASSRIFVHQYDVEKKFGLKIPNDFKLEKFDKSIEDQNKADDLSHRWKQYKLNMNQSDEELINKNCITCNASSNCTITEIRKFKLSRKFNNQNASTCSLLFKKAVGELPSFDNENLRLFQDFFNRFGMFFITEAFIGGSIHQSCDKSTKWFGGRTDYHQEHTGKCWIQSLFTDPTLLLTELRLEPISTAVGFIDKSKEKDTLDALKWIAAFEDVYEPEIFTRKEASERFISNKSIGLMAGGSITAAVAGGSLTGVVACSKLGMALGPIGIAAGTVGGGIMGGVAALFTKR